MIVTCNNSCNFVIQGLNIPKIACQILKALANISFQHK